MALNFIGMITSISESVGGCKRNVWVLLEKLLALQPNQPGNG